MIVGDILDLYGGLRDCEILTNRQTRNNVIKNVSLFEVPDGMFWTKENEFLITTGYFLKESNLNLIDVLRTLINNECAGIGIKLGRFINEISNDVIEYANKYNFAIVKIPVEITYNDMLLPMISFLNEDSNYINNESVKFSKEIHSIMYNQGDLNDFYNILKYRFNYKIDYFIINYDNHHIDEKLLKSIKVFTEYNLPNIFRNYISDFNTYKIGTSENEYIILPIFNFNRVSSFICISTKYKIKKNDIKLLKSINDTLVIFNNYILDQSSSFRPLDEKSLYKKLINGEYVNRINLLEKDLYMLNLSKEDKHIIINIKFENMNYSKLKKFLKNSERYLPNYSFKRFIILKNFNLIIVCRNLKDEKLSIIIDYIKNFFKTNFDKENYHIGISKNVSGYENIFKSYNRTVTTINILKRMENKNIGFYEDFILYDFMFDISNIESVNNLKELTFDKLLKYDSKNNTNFFKSLYEYVDSDFNVNKAADKLFIHRNTMYNRLNKISKILDIDLNESSNRFILQLVKSIEKIK